MEPHLSVSRGALGGCSGLHDDISAGNPPGPRDAREGSSTRRRGAAGTGPVLFRSAAMLASPCLEWPADVVQRSASLVWSKGESIVEGDGGWTAPDKLQPDFESLRGSSSPFRVFNDVLLQARTVRVWPHPGSRSSSYRYS